MANLTKDTRWRYNIKPIYKRAKDGSVQEWKIAVENHTDGTATIVVTHGKVDGQQQVVKTHITEGKNPGKKNATTPQEQALKEAEAEHTKKLERKRYGFTVEESDVKRAASPMLAHTYEDHANKVEWNSGRVMCQPKFDGHRCLAFHHDDGELKLYSREGVEITSVPHIVEQLKVGLTKGKIFDGELYIHGRPLNKIASFIRRKQAESANLCYMMYDTVDHTKPFEQRFNEMRANIGLFGPNQIPHLHIARTQKVASEAEALSFQAACIENGYEGAMLRHGDHTYESGDRSHGLLKMKTFVDDEFKVIGCKEGVGPYAGMAIFECVTAEGHSFDVTAPGTHEDKKAFWTMRDQFIGSMLTVKFQNFSATAKPVPIFPVAKNFVNAHT